MHNFLKRFGVAVRDGRIYAGITQRDLAKRLNVTAHHLGGIENGYEKPSLDLFRLLIEVLDIQTDSIFHPEMCQKNVVLADIVLYVFKCDDVEYAEFITTIGSLVQFKTFQKAVIPDS